MGSLSLLVSYSDEKTKTGWVTHLATWDYDDG
jgi:hypothetical protein